MSIENNVSDIKESAKNWSSLKEKISQISNPFGDDVDLKNSNANVNGTSVQGKMSQIGTELTKMYALENMVSKRFAKAHKNGDIHIHDLDYYLTKTTTCNQIPLGQMLKNGIWNEHGYIRPPKGIKTAAALAAVIFQYHQNQQHGGQSFASFDFDMAPYVKLTFDKIKNNLISDIEFLDGDKEIDENKLDERAWELTENETLQAMEALVHNLNTMHSRAGAQVPFTSINFGLDTSKEGRMVSKCLMQAQSNGLGNGETPIFPILVFKVKEGINYNPEDKNYDLLKMSFEVTAKRLFPNWIFEDAPFNLACYDEKHPELSIATMGCRTRLARSVFEESDKTSVKRGNISFTSINLPRLGILANKNIDKFFELLDEKLDLVHDQLLERYKYQCTADKTEFEYMVKNKTMIGAEEFEKSNNAEDMVKHGSLSIGFIGLAETLVSLIGKHHGESEEAQELGLKIVKHMREYCDKKAEEEKLNWSLLGTPAEGLSNRFTKIDLENFGKIDGVTDHDFYTNSSHVPVYHKISAFKKIEIEAPYHELENAGHICYIEMDGDPSNNIEAVEKVVRKMHDEGIGYSSINHPVDRCKDCGFSGIMNDKCPICGSTDIERLRRITGYLVGDLKRWNGGKRAEEKQRVKHI